MIARNVGLGGIRMHIYWGELRVYVCTSVGAHILGYCMVYMPRVWGDVILVVPEFEEPKFLNLSTCKTI